MDNQIQTATASPAVKQQARIEDPLADNFFTPVANTKPYFKAGIQGLAGTGKTYTAAEIAIGLHKRLGSKKPVVVKEEQSPNQATQTQSAPTPQPSSPNYYINSDGNKIQSPTRSHDGNVHAGATARCSDGTYSFSQHRQGTCSHHGGVADWLY